ncbi:MAG: hypothetical protein FWF56_04805 [Firmicutes bacterium]|nr:hypothetical protein [Bacillota bacterium]
MAYDPLAESASWFARATGYQKGTSEYDEFVKKMEELLNKPYDKITPDKPDTPKYDEMDMDERSYEELQELARNQLEEYRLQQQNAINNKKETESNALNDSLANAEKLLQQRQEEIEAGYEIAKDSLNSDLNKRGLSRSSIAANTNTKLENSKASAINENQNQYSQHLQEIQSQLSKLEAERLQALDQFDITYAAKLTTSINELVQARDKANVDALKYNNSIKEQIQNDYGDSLVNTEKEETINQAAKEKQMQERQQEFYNQARVVLASMSPKEVRQKLEKDPIFRNLPQHMYTALFREFVK